MAETRPASSEPIGLSQAILAPLDAIFKAQIHAARSYINMLWQMAYPHIPVSDDGTMRQPTGEEKKPYSFPVSFETTEGGQKSITTVNIPTIAMIPITPLGVEEASIKFSMSVTEIGDHHQLQETEAIKHQDHPDQNFSDTKRPWYLVQCPVSLRGNIVASNSSNSSIEVAIKISKSPIPAALEKSLTILTQNISVEKNSP